MAGRLDGEVALISGASRGQGAAEARMFAREDRGIEQTSLETWHKTIAVNQTGVFLGMKYAIPAMRQAERILWVGSPTRKRSPMACSIWRRRSRLLLPVRS